jgi:AraC-like DNA-binding protein
MPNWSTYFTPSQSERQLGLFCLGAGEQENPKGPAPERALGCHALVWIKEGRGHLLHGPDRQLHQVEAPAMLWLYPGVLHGYRPTTRWRQAWTLFSGPATDALTTLGHLDPTQQVRRYTDPRPIDRAFTRLLRVTRAQNGIQNVVQTIAALYDVIAQAAPPPDDGIADQLARLACKPLSIQDYATELGLTLRELRDAIKRTTGSTPQELVLTTRLNTAKALLAEEDLPVTAIARQVGYDDPAYFSRLFTSRVGQSPRAFRQFGSMPPE